jgi:F-type H+-transporting ATPase subunit b
MQTPFFFAAGLAFDATFFALVALILFLGVVVWAGAHKTAGKALDDRSVQIAKDLADAKRLREEAEALLNEYKQKRLDAEKEAADIVSRARADAHTYGDDAKRKLADMLERRTKQAEQKIALAEASATKDVRAAATELAIAAATRVLADGAKGAGGSKMIEDSIGAVRTKLN